MKNNKTKEFKLTFLEDRIIGMLPIKTDSEIKYCAERLYWIANEFVSQLSIGQCILNPDEMISVVLTGLRDKKDTLKDVRRVNSFLTLVANSVFDLLDENDCKPKVSRKFFATQFVRSVELKWATIRSIFHEYRFYYRDKLLNLGFDTKAAKSIIESGMAWSETSTKYYYSYQLICQDFISEVVRICREKGKKVNPEYLWLNDLGEMPVPL